MINKFLIFLAGLLVSSLTIAGHHEESKTIAPVASAGQVVVVYEVPCENVATGLSALKDLIAYEASASPIAYSSSPATIGEGAIGAVDLHLSASSMEKAVTWQEGNAKWKALQAASLKACDVNVDDIKVTVIASK